MMNGRMNLLLVPRHYNVRASSILNNDTHGKEKV
jgi:hypothetical protein